MKRNREERKEGRKERTNERTKRRKEGRKKEVGEKRRKWRNRKRRRGRRRNINWLLLQMATSSQGWVRLKPGDSNSHSCVLHGEQGPSTGITVKSLTGHDHQRRARDL